MTVEELLGLPPAGWQAIAAMDEAALSIYLKDITNLEPIIPEVAQPCGREPIKLKLNKDGKSQQINELDIDDNPDNPIHFKRKEKTGARKLNKNQIQKAMDDEINNIINELE